MATLAASTAAAAMALAPLFTDHMVIQQGRENPIWGTDTPNTEVVIKIDGAGAERVVTAKADDSGKWSAVLPELPVGGPYTIKVDGSGEDVLDDVLVGEVWLVSGQSNMEFRVEQAMSPQLEIATANNSRIRHFKVEQCASDKPLDSVNGAWETTSPTTVGSFSAIGYFFAREISERLNVPVGIINSTWGGTCVEAWTSLDVVEKYLPAEEVHPSAEVLAERKIAYEKYLAESSAWRLAHLPADPGNVGIDKGWANVSFDDSGWTTFRLPNYWQSLPEYNFNGSFWLRREIDIPAAWEGRDLALSLGFIDDYDTTYFNGEQVGETPRGTVEAYTMARHYTVPAKAVKAGKSVIAIRVYDEFGNGGVSGAKSLLWIAPADGKDEAVSLAGDWKLKNEHNIGVTPVSVFSGIPTLPGYTQKQNLPAHLYNGMISALIPYGMRGVLWYQGEQNESNYETYGERVRAMIRDWRNRWGEGNFPFYYVQLASFSAGYPWAELRAQQDAALLEPNTGRALSIDIGDPTDIHPKNKQDVARRLARNALAKTYGFSGVEYSGPVFDKVDYIGGKAIVSFTHASGLHTTGNATTVLGFELAGPDGVFHPATGVVKGEGIVVTSEKVKEPVSIRYAWSNKPEVNLVNGDNLPLAPFKASK
jgi:sialate O-acetylesterase